MDAGLTQGLNADPVNWLLYGELAVVVIATSAFLFYFNRLFGSVFAFFVRLYTWRRHHAYITIGSLQISPLAGRIAFRDLEYHSSNLSVRVLHGHVTFRYWWVRVKQEGDSQSVNSKRKKLPCRILVYAEGLETFVYNRTPAYDAIVERMKKHESDNGTDGKDAASSHSSSREDTPIKARLRNKFRSANGTGGKDGDLTNVNSTTSSESTDEKAQASSQPDRTQSLPAVHAVDWFREMLPIELKIVTGSVVLGSDATPMILIGDFKRAEGFLEVTDSRSVWDQYKFLVDLSFDQPKVLYRTNVEWSGPLLAHGKKVYDELIKREAEITKQPPSTLSLRNAFHAFARKYAFLRDPTYSRPPRAGLPQDRTWRGLARYRDEGSKGPPKHEKEYAKVATLLESPRLDFTYFSDTPGLVPYTHEVELPDEMDELGNVDLPPEYGMDIVIHGGMVKYGPWADRQRDSLQRTFAPSIFFDSEPKARLQAGDTRLHANLVLTVQFTEETILRIPTREPSKDWQYDSNPDADLSRRYGWLDVTTGANSSVIYTQSQYATAHGYDAMAVLHLDSLTIASSVNLQSFVKAQACKVSLTMPTPLRWDAQRNWGIDLTLESPDITLLRDHITLISDLSKDWSSGYTGDFHHFVPTHYSFRIALAKYAFHLYINDSNIVDQPQSRDDNAFLDVYGPHLSAHVAVASTRFKPELSVIPFSVKLNDARAEVGLPKYDTHRSFSDFEAFEVGKIGSCEVSGSYLYYSRAHPDHQETLNLRLEAKRGAFKCLGWVLRRLFCVKDNYFGMFTQFTTTQEYLERFDHDPRSVGDPVEEKWTPGRSDAMSTNISMDIQDSLILLSDEIYACDSGLAMPIPQLQMSLKSVEAFMELSIDVPPTYIVLAPGFAPVYRDLKAPPVSSTDIVLLEGLSLKANRLFGPQPRGTTYLCLWEAVIPKVTVLATPDFLIALRRSIQAVAYNFSDKENAPTSIYIPQTPPDVTFFKLTLDAASIGYFANNSAVSVELPAGVNLDTSTLATTTCSSSIGVLAPLITVHLLDRASHRLKWTSVGSMRTGLSIDLYKAPRDWQEKAARQQEFIREEDGPTQRIWYMYRDGEEESNGHHLNLLYLPRPRVVVDTGERNVVILSLTPDDDDGSDSETEVDLQRHRSRTSDSVSGSDHRSSSRPAQARSRSRSFKTAKETIHDDSSGEESGEISSAASSRSSTSMKPRRAVDMASVIADRMKYMRSFRTAELIETDENNSSQPPGCNVIGQQASAGTIIRVAIEPVYIQSETASVTAISKIIGAAQHSLRPTQILDTLLVAQVTDFSDRNLRPVPLTVDVSLSRLRISTDTRTKELSSALHLDLSRGSITISKDASNPENPVTEATASVRSLQLSFMSTSQARPPTSLVDIGEGFFTPKGYALLRLDQLGSSVGISIKGDHKQIKIDSTSSDLKFVSPVFGLARDTATCWMDPVKAIPTRIRTASSSARLIGDLLAAAHTADGDISFAPAAFVSELTYGLHVTDDRSLRYDYGWRLVAQLRQIMLEKRDLPNLNEFDPDLVLRELEKLDWIPGEGSEDLTRRQAFVKAAKLSSASGCEQSNSEGDHAAFLNMSNIVIRHYDRLLGSGRIGASTVRIGPVSAGVYRAEAQIREKAENQIRGLVAISTIDVEIQDSIFAAIRQVLAGLPDTDVAQSESAPVVKTPAVMIKGVLLLLSLDLQACELAILAGGLRLRTRLIASSAAFTHRKRLDDTTDGTVITGRNNLIASAAKAELVLLQPTDDLNPANTADREVIVTAVESIKVVSSTLGSTKPGATKRQHIAISAQSFLFDSRPTLRRFLDFAQNWQEKHYPHYEPMVKQMKSAMAKNPTRVPQANPLPVNPPPVNLNLDLTVNSAKLKVRAAKNAWLGWQLGKIYACQQGSAKNHSFGIRADAQDVGFYSTRNLARLKDTVKVDLPAVNIDGRRSTINGKARYAVNIGLGYFASIVKPSALERFLSLHKSLAPEVRQLVADYGNYARSLLPPQQTVDPKETVLKQAAQFSVDISIEGVSIGLRADDVATTLLFMTYGLKGHATNQDNIEQALTWRVGARHFEISLGQLNEDCINRYSDENRRYKSAYMRLDVAVHESPSDIGAPSQLGISLSKVQTFMHIAALSEVSDLVSSWTSDLHVLTDKRADEVAEVKQQTSKFLKKIDTSDKGLQPEASWFATRLLTLEISSFGLAVPLGNEVAFNLQEQKDAVGPALLWSVRSIVFQNRRNETARFRVQNIGLQFVGEFDHKRPDQFAGEYHSSLNKMTLPLIDSEAQMLSNADAWTVSANCLATDFELHLDPHVVDGVFQLIDLYERGKDRIAQLDKKYRTESVKKEIVNTVAARYEDPDSPISTRSKQKIILRLSFTFDSGKVQLHRLSSSGNHEKNSPVRGVKQRWHDLVVLPGISLWVDYTGPRRGDPGEEDSAGLAVLNAAVHQSKNTLHPSILPFVVQLVNRIETRVKAKGRRRSSTTSQPVAPPPNSEVSTGETRIGESESTLSSLVKASATIVRIRFTLRIDRSELCFSCEPDNRSSVNLCWDSGGFVASATVGAEEMSTVAGTISGVTTNLNHAFISPRSCIEAGARDLTFSITYTPRWRENQGGLSVVMDTKISAQFRVDLFNAWLTFIAVWVDNAPTLDLPIMSAITDPSALAPPPPTVDRRKIGIAVLARFQAIDFDADVSVTHAKLQIAPVVLHTLSDGTRTRVDLIIGKIEVIAHGEISGTIRSETLEFHTTRKSSRASDISEPQLLAMTIKAGDLSARLFLGETNIVRFRLAPSNVSLSDDWKDARTTPLLSFTVNAGKLFMVVRLLAIPKLLSKIYDILDSVETQHKIAGQRSEVFRNREIRRHTAPSPIAAALIQTMQKTSTPNTVAAVCDLRIAQVMSFQLDGIDIGIFNEDYGDGRMLDFYRFVVGAVHADLKRVPAVVDGEDRPYRDLGLSVAYIRWDHSDGRRAAGEEKKDLTAEQMITRAVRTGRREVASLPSMSLNMNSDELKSPIPTLLYHFTLVWGETDGDIAILPNFFEQAYKALKQIITDIEKIESSRAETMAGFKVGDPRLMEREKEKERQRQREKEREKQKERRLSASKPNGEPGETTAETIFPQGSLRFEPRDPLLERDPPIPRLKLLGEGTTDAAKLIIPRFQQGVRELPKLSHLFVTTSLEEAMDLLLKLYEKQLPDKLQ